MNAVPPCCIVMTVEIALPGNLDDELQDAIVDDLTHELHIERLARLIQHWARLIAGEHCHISIDVE